MFKRTTLCGDVSLQESGCVEDFVAVLIHNGYTVQIALNEYTKMLDISIMKYEEER